MNVNSLSVFFPAFNDQKTIKDLILKSNRILESLNIDYEIIVIDDGSQDKTLQVVKDLARSNEHIQLVCHKENKGYGAALQQGFSHSTKEWIFYTDSDGQYDIADIKKLLPYTNQFNWINGYYNKRNDPLIRIILGNIYQWILKTFFQIKLNYVDCDFRLINRKCLQNIEIKSKSGFACAELVIKLTKKQIVPQEVLIEHYPRKHGKSQFFCFRKIFALIHEMLTF